MISRLTLALVINFIATLASPGTGKSLSDDKLEVHGTNQASTRLMKELVEIYKSDSYKRGVIEVELVDDNLYEWNVKMFFKDPKCRLYGDLKRMKSEGKEDHVMARLSFGDDYPNSPPSFRFLYPILRGFEQRGGAICLYLLSPQGWFSECPTEALILNIIELMTIPILQYHVDFEIDSPDARKKWYTPERAQKGFLNEIGTHGWHIPKERTDGGT